MPIPSNALHFSGPIAGSSLTRAPGSVPWEKPPMYTTVDDAMKFFVQQFQNPMMVHSFLATIEAGAPLDVTIYTILSHGFAEGKWTPSLMVMLIKPFTALCVMLLHRAKIKYIPSYSQKKGQLDNIFDLINQKKAQDKVTNMQVKNIVGTAKTATAPSATPMPATPAGGLMSPPTQTPQTPDQSQAQAPGATS